MKNDLDGNFPVLSRLEFTVRWGDSDAAGVTYYAKYFDWFTDGRIALMQQVGLPYMETVHYRGFDMLVIDAHCYYKASLRPEEKAILETGVTSLSRTRVAFAYRVLREDGATVVEGATTHAFVDRQGKPFNLAKKYPDLWEALCQKLNFAGSA